MSIWETKTMVRGSVFWLLTSVLLAIACPTGAQQSARVPRIGFLAGNSFSISPGRIEAFRQGLREFGYIEGKSIVIEWRSAEGNFDRLPALAAELVRLKVDVIVSYGPIPTRIAKEATTSIPIVMSFDSDPVGSRFVASLARPGGNITGLSTFAPEVAGKQLQLLKEIVPKLSRVAVFGHPTEPGNVQNLGQVELAAKTLGVRIHYFNCQSLQDFDSAFREAIKAHADAVVVLQSPTAIAHRTEIVRIATRGRLPASFPQAEFVEDGGLISYGTKFPELYRRAATYVDKILKGAKPGDLPIEQPTKFELVINRKTADALGIKLSEELLFRADRVIE